MDAAPRVWLMDLADRGVYYAQWLDPDTRKRVTRSLKTADEREAERKRAWIEDRLAQGLPIDEERLSWSEFRRRFMAGHGPAVRAATREKLRHVMGAVERFAAPATVRALDAAALRRMAQAMRSAPRSRGRVGYAPETIRSYLGDVRTMLGYALREGWIRAVPEIPAVKVPRRRPQPVRQEDYDLLLAAAPDDAWRALLMLYWHCGLRLSEAYQCRREASRRWPWLDLGEDARVWLPADFAKGCEDSWMPLPPALRDALTAMPARPDGRVFLFCSRTRPGQELSRQGVGGAVRDKARRAGVDLGAQALRRGFGCRVASREPMAVAQRLMRHKDPRVTYSYYVSADDGALRRAVERA